MGRFFAFFFQNRRLVSPRNWIEDPNDWKHERNPILILRVITNDDANPWGVTNVCRIPFSDPSEIWVTMFSIGSLRRDDKLRPWWHGIERPCGSIHRSWQDPQQTFCEGNNVENFPKSVSGEVSPDNPYKEQIEDMRRDLEEPCKACMYTGVSVCVGLSLYFVKLATDETTLHKNRRFLWICSSGSLVVGAYRWYLG